MTNAQVARSDHDLLIVMNTKLDVALGQLADHQAQIRVLEARPVGDPEVRVGLEVMGKRVDELGKRGDDHESRLRRVEILVWRAAGAAAALGGLGGLVLDRVAK